MNAKTLLAEYPQPDAAAKRLGITVVEYRKRMDALAHPAQGVHPAPSKLPQEMLNELEAEKVLSAVYSQRQLQQQLTDFWLTISTCLLTRISTSGCLPPTSATPSARTPWGNSAICSKLRQKAARHAFLSR